MKHEFETDPELVWIQYVENLQNKYPYFKWHDTTMK
jgi:hypothetical protein